MKMSKRSDWMERLRKLAKGKKKETVFTGLKRKYGKRAVAAGIVGAFLCALLMSAGIYGITTRTMVEKTNEMVLGEDYVEWIRAQIEDATYLTVENYMEGEGGTLSDYVNRNDVNGITEKILREIDRRYEESGNALSPGQRDQMERVIKSEINNSIETALTALAEQNVEELTEKTYRYVASYVSENLKEVLGKTNRNEEELNDLKERDRKQDERLASGEDAIASLNGKTGEQAKGIDALEGKTKENEKKIGTLEGRSDKQDAEVSTLQERANGHDADVNTLQERANGHDADVSTLQERANGHDAEVSTLQERANGHDAEVSTLQERANGHDADVSTLQERANGHDADVSTLTERADRQDGAVDALNARAGQNEENISALQGSFSAQQAEDAVRFSGIESRLQELSGRIVFCTQQQYNAMQHMPQTLYCITN